MGKIHILDESLINKIAAGEVIERPGSIVKELIENSIDAHANKIFIDVKEGGKSYIKVADDGSGMSKEDAALSWRRHTTSKIKDVSDLFTVSTLGFRGEALASMAAVSQLAVSTKIKDEAVGIKIIVKAGQELSSAHIGTNNGTTIELRDLFFNTPVRKKYLKSMEVELRHITDIVTRYAIMQPGIHFRLKHHSKEILNAPSADFGKNLQFIYGNEAKNFLELDYSDSNYKIFGFISKPALTKSTKTDQSLYINKRYIKNSILSSALNDAYKTLVMVNRYPVAAINIGVTPKLTDVNVHPQKTEIRIKHEQKLYQAVFEAVSLTLLKNDLIPQQRFTENKNIGDYTEGYNIEPKQELLVKETGKVYAEKLTAMNVLGVVNKTYILAEMPGNLLLIDQHAAAERILYEKFKKELKEKAVKIQDLLDPKILKLTPVQFNSALDNKVTLLELGYKVEEFGPNTILIRTIPIVLGKQFDEHMFLDFIDELENGRPTSLDKFFHDRIARMSCRTAIKAGDEITLPQIKKYIIELMDQDIPYTCPHGRPIMIKWSNYELEKMFKRVV